MKTFTSKTQQTGEKGEQETVNFLIKNGFTVLERNYTKKWGEIDIVAKKGTVLHFIEVKSVSLKDDVSCENNFRPEDNMHPWKIKRLQRTLETYLLERRVGENQEWQFDLSCVYFSKNSVKVDFIDDLVLV